MVGPPRFLLILRGPQYISGRSRFLERMAGEGNPQIINFTERAASVKTDSQIRIQFSTFNRHMHSLPPVNITALRVTSYSVLHEMQVIAYVISMSLWLTDWVKYFIPSGTG